VSQGLIRAEMSACLDRHAGRTAVVGGGEVFTYSDLGRRIRDAADLLRQALPAAGHLGFCLANRAELVILYFGALEAGCLPLLLDASFNTGEIAAIRGDCALDALVIEKAKAEALDIPGKPGKGEPVPFAEGVAVLPLARAAAPPFTPRPDTEICRFTSGTTGRPKCLEFSGHAVVSAARNWVAGTGMTADDRTLCLAALSNGLAFNTSLLSTFIAGGALNFLKGQPLTRPVARRIEEDGITRLVAFPTLYRNFIAPGGPDRSALASHRAGQNCDRGWETRPDG